MAVREVSALIRQYVGCILVAHALCLAFGGAIFTADTFANFFPKNFSY